MCVVKSLQLIRWVGDGEVDECESNKIWSINFTFRSTESDSQAQLQFFNAINCEYQTD